MKISDYAVRVILLLIKTLLIIPLNGQPSDRTITFNEDIAPIIQQHCTPCHQEGQVGPMPFTNYEETAAYGAMIAYVTKSRYMPPWRAKEGYGEFADEMNLSEEVINRIQQWAAAGFPEGAGEEVRLNSTVRPAENWDLEISLDTAFEQYDIYYDQFQVFRLSTGLKEGRWVESIGFTPGDASIVRYASLSLSEQSAARRLDNWDPRYGYTSFGGVGFVADYEHWFSWSIGDQPEKGGNHKRWLPADADLLLYVHYGPTASKKFDRSKLHFRFTKDDTLPVQQTVALINPMILETGDFLIEANSRKTLQASTILANDIVLTGIEPKGLLLTESWEIFARLPDGGSVVPLLKIEEYDMHWRRAYSFAQPMLLPAGTRIHARAIYDNRLSNPFIPVNPPVDAQWGYRLYNEQFAVYFHLQTARSEAVTLIPGPVNQTKDYRMVTYRNSSSEKLQLVVENLANSEEFIQLELAPGEAGYVNQKISIANLAYGNYQLSIIDSSRKKLSSQYFAYWPQTLSKSLLDE